MINSKPKIAVLLAVYNGKQWLNAQVDSILLQIDVDVTIFVSVDTSTDGSEHICNTLAQQFHNIMVLPLGDKFGGAGKNFFRLIRDVDFTHYDYVAFADQDDIWFENKLIRAVSMLNNTQADGYSSNVTAFWSAGKQQLIKKSQPQREWDYLFEAAGPGCTYVMTSQLAIEIKNVVVKYWLEVNQLAFHDWFSYAYARANGFPWVIDDEPSMLYRQHENNQVGANHGIKAFSYRFKKVLGGWGITQAVLVAKLVGKGDSIFVKRWAGLSRMGFMRLAFSANQCRRKPIERVYFFLACLLMAVVGIR
ncbi:MAG: glycosyltransferase [Methylotenera sp.]|nr:glycosyltransferase [Methylotenera sp.]